MNKLVLLLCFASAIFLVFTSFQIHPAESMSTTLRWYTWEEAVQLNKTRPRKIFVYIYTDWCGWSKRMERSALTNEQVSEYLAANFYPVKLNAEQKTNIYFNGYTYKYIAGNNGRGYHQFSEALCSGGYPKMAYLNEKLERITSYVGNLDAPILLKQLRFVAEEQYNKMTWEQYKAKY